jgi:catechol 2,3-dioxygenase-like lactoylglutathione lyase family enzyme
MRARRLGATQVVVIALAALALPTAALAQSSDPRVSPVRRTTIATADIDASLRFWRDLLGFVVEYDQRVDDSATLSLYLPGATAARVLALRRGDRLGGSVGLFHAREVQPAPRRCPASALRAGTAAVLLLTDDLPTLVARLRTARVQFLADDVSYSRSRGPTDAVTVFDPNCTRVAIAQIKSEAFEESLGR